MEFDSHSASDSDSDSASESDSACDSDLDSDSDSDCESCDEDPFMGAVGVYERMLNKVIRYTV